MASLSGHTVPQNSSVSSLEENAKPSPEVGDGFPFGLPSVPCQAAAQLFDLPLGSCVPPTHRLHHKGKKENTLALAVLCCTSHLPIIGKLKGMSRFQSCLSHCCCLEGVDDCDIQSSIAASIPVWEEDVCRPAIIPW